MASQPSECENIDAGVISDDSSFYGDEDTKSGPHGGGIARLDTSEYWATHHSLPSVVASRSNTSTSKDLQKLYNIYAEYPSGRRLSETVDDFLLRLPPSSSKIEDCGPWIYVSNPSCDPASMSEDVRGLRKEASKLLDSFELRRRSTEEGMSDKPQTAIGRKITPLRTQLSKDIYALGREKGITAGKWMIFPHTNDVDRVWRLIVSATVGDKLGHAAKVASNDGSGDTKPRLICIYNQDWEDTVTVKKILTTLNDMKLAKSEGPYGRERGIYYKADVLSWLDINGGNQYGLKASLYASMDVLREGWKC